MLFSGGRVRESQRFVRERGWVIPYLFCEACAALLHVVVEFYDAVFERYGALSDAQEGRDGGDKVVVVFGADELDLAFALGDKVSECGEVGILLLGAVDVDSGLLRG